MKEKLKEHAMSERQIIDSLEQAGFTEAQIVAILKEGEAGRPVAELLRKHEISSATYYAWKSKYGGLTASELKRLKELERLTPQ